RAGRLPVGKQRAVFARQGRRGRWTIHGRPGEARPWPRGQGVRLGRWLPLTPSSHWGDRTDPNPGRRHRPPEEMNPPQDPEERPDVAVVEDLVGGGEYRHSDDDADDGRGVVQHSSKELRWRAPCDGERSNAGGRPEEPQPDRYDRPSRA